MKTILVLVAVALMACGGSSTAPQACVSTCTIARPWIRSSDGDFARYLHLENGSPAHWTEAEMNGLSCTYDVTLAPAADGLNGSATSALTSTDSEPTVGDNTCPTLPSAFTYSLDQCNCALTLSATGFSALYY